jgi:tRNA wybutosine-synthesizing protein 4
MPHFFRYFTKSTKKGRRAPLINRGYWLRMHSVEYVVKEFLGQITAEKKVVINLGCG